MFLTVISDVNKITLFALHWNRVISKVLTSNHLPLHYCLLSIINDRLLIWFTCKELWQNPCSSAAIYRSYEKVNATWNKNRTVSTSGGVTCHAVFSAATLRNTTKIHPPPPPKWKHVHAGGTGTSSATFPATSPRRLVAEHNSVCDGLDFKKSSASRPAGMWRFATATDFSGSHNYGYLKTRSPPPAQTTGPVNAFRIQIPYSATLQIPYSATLT